MEEDLYEENKAVPSDDARRHELEDIEFLLKSPNGRRFLSRLIHEVCGFNRSSFTGNSRTFFMEGQRNVALTIFADIVEINPEYYSQLLTESSNERRASSAN